MVTVISADVPHRGPVRSSLSLAVGRLVTTTAIAIAGAFGLGLGFHLGFAVAGGRILITYPGTPRPGETVLAPNASGAQFVTAGPATLAEAHGHLVVDGVTTMWSATASAPTTVPVGAVLVITQAGYRVVRRDGVCLASPL